MTYTAWFHEIRKDDVALAGGKGANLGELSHAGLPVPPGFVVITTAYDAFEAVAEGISALFSGGRREPRGGNPEDGRVGGRGCDVHGQPLEWAQGSGDD
jgi:hypothetical protein